MPLHSFFASALARYERGIQALGKGAAYVGEIPVVGIVARVPAHAARHFAEGYHQGVQGIMAKSLLKDPTDENVKRWADRMLDETTKTRLKEAAKTAAPAKGG